jgi:bifunctional non-homologous end joining protein LigD
MPLDEYRAKRDFSTSPEPAGGPPRREHRRDRIFCVQKHLATQLHYDFRLEHDGVLLSWAVPKGPSLDPAEKRLAVRVEDHPLEYADFEGVIPGGYGAGVVMLWDRGTWEPLVDDVAAALERGDLKLRLEGYKLKGSWALVRTKGWGSRRRDDGRSWLLLKHRDEWAGALDIASFAPHSVKSGGGFSDILSADLPEVWTRNPGGRSDPGLVASLTRIVARVEALERPGAAGAGPEVRARRGRRTPS